MLTGGYAVFWFVTCLLITQVVMAGLTTLIKQIPLQIAVILVLYILAHVETSFFPNANIPWNADVAFLAMTYYAAGYYVRPILQKLFQYRIVFLCALMLPAILITGDLLHLFQYKLDMKVLEYTNWFLDLFIPLAMTLSFLTISYWIVRLKTVAKILSYIGLMSLTIMYMHFPINLVFEELTGEQTVIQYLLLGVIIPVFLHLVISRITLAKILFLGSLYKAKAA